MENDSIALTSASRLEKIDKLRDKNIGKLLALPQLVAFGDQSSGKSSLLETVTGIPFPRGQELCTRYATQITHRRNELSYIDITIIPGPLASPRERECLESYHKRFHSGTHLYEQFPAIVDEVNILMDIRTPTNPAGAKTFTEDVLKIEKCGPHEDYLTVIDVPGIFRNTTAGVTTKEDRSLVETMIRNYARDPRTIILAVLPCNVDVTTQEILAIAEEYDRDGERTLGVLTKPDLLQERSAKASVCSLVRGHRRPLKLGYHVVRSRGGDEDDRESHSSAVQRQEIMFQEEPWRSLPSDRVGVRALRQRLQELLGQVTDKEFPKLREEAREILADIQAALDDLGQPRQTAREQQQYLASAASKFQNLARAGINGDYTSRHAFENTDLRLATRIANVTDKFNELFARFAHTHTFDHLTGLGFAGLESLVLKQDRKVTSREGTRFDEVFPNFPELRGIVVPDSTLPPPKPGILEWIGKLYRSSRTLELGTHGPRLLASAFQEQSQKWELLATQYLSKVIILVHKFITSALKVSCTDMRVCEEITCNILDELLQKYEAGMMHARLLVTIERERTPYTLNHYFNSNIQMARGVRMKSTLESKAHDEVSLRERVVSLEDISEAVSHKSNLDQIKEDIHDSLEAFYKVSRKRFVDNIYLQAVDHLLLTGPSSPLWLFSEQWVLRLTDEKLGEIAGESRATTERRRRLAKTAQDLNEALEILR